MTQETCRIDRGWASSHVGLVVRYPAADLSRLPDDLGNGFKLVTSAPRPVRALNTILVAGCRDGDLFAK
jgi:hypothetical protein